MRLTGPLGLLIMAAVIFASFGKVRIERTSAMAVTGLRGEAATAYLKQQALYSLLVEAVKAARLEAAGREARSQVDDRGASYQSLIAPTFTQIKGVRVGHELDTI